jgi:hypothetical protein
MQTMSEAIKQRLAEGKNIGLYPVIIPPKPEDNMNLNIEKLQQYFDAVTTQYQIIGAYENLNDESFKPRASLDTPTFTQLHNLREAHLNIQTIIKLAIQQQAQLSRLDDVEGLAEVIAEKIVYNEFKITSTKQEFANNQDKALRFLTNKITKAVINYIKGV